MFYEAIEKTRINPCFSYEGLNSFLKGVDFLVLKTSFRQLVLRNRYWMSLLCWGLCSMQGISHQGTTSICAWKQMYKQVVTAWCGQCIEPGPRGCKCRAEDDWEVPRERRRLLSTEGCISIVSCCVSRILLKKIIQNRMKNTSLEFYTELN